MLACVLFVYYLLPVVTLWTSQSPSALADGITSEFVLTVATNSIVAASISAVLAIVMLPLVLPPVVSGMLLLKVVGSAGLGRVVTVPLTRSLFGVILAQTYVASPFLVVTAKTAFDGVDRELEAAARSLGEDGLGAIRRITLPLAKPGFSPA